MRQIVIFSCGFVEYTANCGKQALKKKRCWFHVPHSGSQMPPPRHTWTRLSTDTRIWITSAWSSGKRDGLYAALTSFKVKAIRPSIKHTGPTVNKNENKRVYYNCLAFPSPDDEDDDEEDSEAGVGGTEAAQAGSEGGVATTVPTSDPQPSNSSQSATQSASSS